MTAEDKSVGTAARRISRNRCAQGWQEVWEHPSTSTGTPMRFGVYLPPAAERGPCPVVYWLSGLTCTEENFIHKSGAQRLAAERGLIVVNPDTSPRGVSIPGDRDGWDFGVGAGFYLNATQAPWSQHYRMEDYVVSELPALIESLFPASSRRGIMGHSMGGHGAMVLALKYPERFDSISAFSPICAPTQCPWGEKAFSGYLGQDRTLWAAYDAHLLLAESARRLPILVDQGTADGFLETQLRPALLEKAASGCGYPLTLRYQEGYDHSYYFISTFLPEHFDWHARQLLS